MGVVGSSLILLIVIGILVITHEFGHLIAARLNGVFVEAFSIGMGPILFEKTDSKGLKWRISLFPLGGYIKMFGDADISSVKEFIPSGYTEEDMDRMSIHRKKPWQKIMVAFGGPLFNLIFAVFVLFFFSTINGIPQSNNIISVPEESSVAYTSGLRDGDAILMANDKKISTFVDFMNQITESHGKILKIKFKRGDEVRDIEVKMYEEKDGEKVPIKLLGVTQSNQNLSYKTLPLLEGAAFALSTTVTYSINNIKSICKIATGEASVKSVGGLISIAKISASSAEAGIANFIWMLAMLSIMLGSVNLLPIPVLDGGTIVISAVEWMIGRQLNKKIVETVFMIGLVVVVALMLVGIWNDLSGCKLFR
ncbi:MAG: M50 family metallopeptidase [Holosporales bacterium]|jgi:regulator of sigma E protease|nr:M50 family metallopeptidase [Holosporales bacterium]